jgi:flagellar hook assembly protein FlgD
VSAPNPFRSATTITIPGPAIDGTELRIYDVRGRMVRVLAARRPQVAWDGRNQGGAPVPAGLYFARLAGAPAGMPAIKLERLP